MDRPNQYPIKTLIGAAAIVFCTLAAAPLYANDLLNAYHDASDRDTQLQSSFYQRQAAIEAHPQALSAFLPQLNASAGITREREAYPVGEQTTVPGTGVGGVPTQTVTSSVQQSFYGNARNYALTLNQTLWSFESFQRLREAHSQVAQAEATFRSAQQNLILRVAQAYFAILSAADNVETGRKEREAFAALLHQAQVRQDTGIGARTDVQEAQSFYDATAEGLIDAENALDDAKRALTQITGQLVDAIQPLTAEIPLAAPTPAEPQDWVEAARRENFDIQAAQFKAEAAQRDMQAIRGKYWPTVGLQASAARTAQDQDFGGNQDIDTIGAVLNWPILQGGLVQSQLRQAKAVYHQAQADYDGVQRDAERQVRKAFRGVITGIERINADRKAASSSEAALGAGKIGLELGTRSEFELLNAQNNYYTAVRSYQQSRYDYLSNVLILKQQAGRLTEADLAEIDRLLVAGASVGSLDPNPATTNATEDRPH